MEIFSEDSKPLIIDNFTGENFLNNPNILKKTALVLVLPNTKYDERIQIDSKLLKICEKLDENGLLITIGKPQDLAHIHKILQSKLRFQSWIVVGENSLEPDENSNRLMESHFGILIHSKYNQTLFHTLTRARYTICPFCGKTTKDYGGKKHTFHDYGTLISDVWKELRLNYNSDFIELYTILSKLFGVEGLEHLKIWDLRTNSEKYIHKKKSNFPVILKTSNEISLGSELLNGDCIEALKKIPDNSVDFVFVDPPYNIKKKYSGYNDSKDIEDYFKWCDSWLFELARVLKPNRTLAILNIPLWAIRHFEYLDTILDFQNWLVWDGLSFPVRKIMPAHYSILCFSKGKPRVIPAYQVVGGIKEIINVSPYFRSLQPLKVGYCLRSSCVSKRIKSSRTRDPFITDLWTDIHRLKHNSRRVDHPCLLPPTLMYRLLAAFTFKGETVLDCFNGAGTTTLTAEQLERKFIGIELSPEYFAMSQKRHQELKFGLDPFRKMENTLTTKNSRVPRVKKNSTGFTKKEVQLDIKSVMKLLGKIPEKADYQKFGKYSIDIVDSLFQSWSDACAAAKTTGMNENPDPVRMAQLNLDL